MLVQKSKRRYRPEFLGRPDFDFRRELESLFAIFDFVPDPLRPGIWRGFSEKGEHLELELFKFPSHKWLDGRIYYSFRLDVGIKTLRLRPFGIIPVLETRRLLREWLIRELDKC